MRIIFGSEYQKGEQLYTVVGLKTSKVVLINKEDEQFTDVPVEDIDVLYIPTGVHDHINYCCPEHGSHVMPHRGCMLR